MLQAICWRLSPGWLRTLGAAPDRWQRGRLESRIATTLVALCALLPLLGLAHVLLPLWWTDPALNDALENSSEWWAGAIFTAFFFTLAWGWRKTGFALQLRHRSR